MYAPPCLRLSPAAPDIRLGLAKRRNSTIRWGLRTEDRLRHVWIVGKTGVGKSTLLANLLAQDLARGAGLALLDPHGELAQTALSLVPSRRTNDICLFEPEDRTYAPSFNPFREGRRPSADSALLSSQLISVFRKHWADSWGPRLEHILRNAILAVASDQRATLLFLYRFITDESLRERVVEKVTDPVVRQFWTKEFPRYGKRLQGEALSPVLNKLGAFVASPLVRGIVAQQRSRIDLREMMDEGRVLIANLSTGGVGEDASHLLGGLLLSSIQLAAMRRPAGSRPFWVYVDEFQHFVSESLATLLSESRKFGVGLILSHQYLGQLPLGLRDAMLGNAGTLIVFRVGAQDAYLLAPELAPEFAETDLQQVPARQFVAKVLARGTALAPFTAMGEAPPTPPMDAADPEVVRQQSRDRYCVDARGLHRSIIASRF